MTDETRQSPTKAVSHVERHPGPFMGSDAELARACAMAVLPYYGSDDGDTHQRILKDGIWNDHVAVQAALAAIHHLARMHEALISAVNNLLDNKTETYSVRCQRVRDALTQLSNSHRPEGS